MNKPITLIFYGADDNAGRAMAEQLRSEGTMSVLLRDAASFHGMTDDPAEKVIIMPDVPERQRQMIAAIYPVASVPLVVGMNSYIDGDKALADWAAKFNAGSEKLVGTLLPVKRGPGRPRKVA